MLASTKPKGGNPMRTISRIHRQRRWLAAGLLAALLAMAAAPAMADDPVPDKTGAFQTTPTAYSVPGYTKPDPDEGDDQGSRRRRRRGRAVGLARHLLDQLRLDAGRRLPGHVHAGRLRAGRDRPHPRQERRAHHVDELHGVRASACSASSSAASRSCAAASTAPPSAARSRSAACRRCTHMFTVGCVGQRRPRLGPLRHHRLLPDRQRLRRRRHRAVPVHDGLHGHHRHHRHRRLRRALELQELLHLQHLHRRVHLPDLRLLGLGRRLAGAARLSRWASATARSTTPAPASSTCRAARWRSITAYPDRAAHRQVRQGRQGQPDPAAPHPDGAARHVHPGLRLVRLQRRQLAGRHRRPHRHRRGQHHARRHVGDASAACSTCGSSTASPTRR